MLRVVPSRVQRRTTHQVQGDVGVESISTSFAEPLLSPSRTIKFQSAKGCCLAAGQWFCASPEKKVLLLVQADQFLKLLRKDQGVGRPLCVIFFHKLSQRHAGKPEHDT